MSRLIVRRRATSNGAGSSGSGSSRTSLSRSPLSNPQSPIHALAARFQSYLYFPDPTPLYVVMGAMAANMMEGHTVWLMLVGPPSSGKTVLLNSLMGLQGVWAADNITGPGALLSGTGKKDKSKAATGGLLRSIGDRGAVVMKDFTSVLSMPFEKMKELLGAFREIYDGRWTRNIGTDGGMALEWEGRIGMLAGVTPVIDSHHSIIAGMGERWTFYRISESDGFGESRTSLRQADPIQAAAEMKELITGFFDGMGLGWRTGLKRREFTAREEMRIIAMAALSARCRSTVIRHAYTREVEDVSAAESPVRLTTVLGQMYQALEAIGLEEEERLRVLRKIAGDSMPQLRKRALDMAVQAALVEDTSSSLPGSGFITPYTFQAAVKVSLSAARRTIEDLAIHGVLTRVRAEDRGEKVEGKKQAQAYRLSDWARGEWRVGYE